MRFYLPGRRAYTMLELIFVIVILGIVASLGTEIIAKVYKQYMVQRAQHRASLKTELAALQIANRLASAIPGTIIRKVNRADSNWEYLDEAMILNTGGNYNLLQWVSADTDSFSASATPGWSGFADLQHASADKNTIITQGSDPSKTKTIITNLNGGTFPSAWNPVVYFPFDRTAYPLGTLSSGTTLSLTGAGATHMSEQYKLAWTSYALVVENKDLYLYYGFDPVTAFTIPDGTKRSLLLKNISTFKFKGSGHTIRFKICKQERMSEKLDDNVTSCKEKAVF